MHLANSLSAACVPAVVFWQTVPPPSTYEVASRKRMAKSENELWIERAKNPDPVEGDSEIDITLFGEEHLTFIEAKLSHDISPRTTYDPERNQIIRNIDCLLEHAAASTPYFWMICRDVGPSRSYVQAIDAYRSTPAMLASALPHRDPKVLTDVIERTTIFLWRELLDLLDVPSLDTEQVRVLEELRRRCN
jgi:hypothetical protein